MAPTWAGPGLFLLIVVLKLIKVFRILGPFFDCVFSQNQSIYTFCNSCLAEVQIEQRNLKLNIRF